MESKLIILFLISLFVFPVVSADVTFIYTDTNVQRYRMDAFHGNNTLIGSLDSGGNFTVADNTTIILTVRQGRFDFFTNPTLLFDFFLDNGVAVVALLFLIILFVAGIKMAIAIVNQVLK